MPLNLSQRLPEGLSAAALSESPLAPDAIDLSSANPSHAELGGPEVSLGASGGRYDATAQGLLAAREALAKTLSAWGRTTRAEQLFLTAGTSEALGHLIKAVCSPGDCIVTARPGYPLVEHIAELEGVGVRAVTSREVAGHWQLDIAALGKALADGARMVVLVSPNNPTGARLSRQTLGEVAALCRRFSVLCVLDEVFAPFGAEPPHVALAEVDAFFLVASLGGLSKAGLWPELKLSWISLFGEREAVEQLSVALEWIGDAYLSVSQPVMQALPELLACLPERQMRVRKRVERNAWALKELPGCTLLPREAGWYGIVRLGLFHPIVRAAARAGMTPAALLLAQQNVSVLPAALFDLPWPDALVFSLLAPPARFDAGLLRLAPAFAALPRRSAPAYSAADGRL